MTAEEDRTRLIGDIARVLREGPVPDDARAAALTFIGWLARRMPGEPVSHCDTSRCTGRRFDGAAVDVPRPKPRTPAGSSFASPPKTEPPRRRDSGYAGPPSGPQPRTSLITEIPPAIELHARPRTAR